MKTRAVIYCRVSTSEQSCDAQKADLLRHCRAKGWDVVRTYEDHGVSGRKDSRPALDELMADIRNPRRGWDVCLVWRFDRAARNTSHLISMLSTMNENSVQFISLHEGIDTTTAMGKLVFTFIAGLAEWEAETIRSRVVSGIRRAQESGKHCGRPHASFNVQEAIRCSRPN